MKYIQYYTFDGAQDSYEGTEHKGGIKKYCTDCGVDITSYLKKHGINV